MASSVFNLGGVISAFDKGRDPLPQYKSNYIKDYLEYMAAPQLAANQKSNIADFDKYIAAYSAGTPGAQRLADEDMSRLSSLLTDYQNFNPLDTYNSIRDANLSSLDKQFTSLANYGSASDKARLAALGLGGRASSGSYGKVLDQIRAARNITPVLGQIYGNLGSDFSRVSGDRYQNLLSTLGLMQQRAGLQDERVTNRLLQPISGRNALMDTTFNNIGALSGLYNQNLAGFRENPSTVGRIGKAVSEVDKSLNSALDTYMSMYGAGALGDSGFLGIGGTTPSNQMPSMNNMGSGGGMNFDQLMQIIQALGRNSSGGSSYNNGLARPWNFQPNTGGGFI